MYFAPLAGVQAIFSILATESFRKRLSRMCRLLCGWFVSFAWSREMAKQAVLLLAHGTPETVEQIPEYLRNVVSGRPLPQSVIEEIQHRYSLIGKSPLTEITTEQARLAREELAAGGD